MKLDLTDLKLAATTLFDVLRSGDPSCHVHPPADRRLALSKVREAVVSRMRAETKFSSIRCRIAFEIVVPKLERQQYVERAPFRTFSEFVIGLTQEGLRKVSAGERPLFRDSDLGSYSKGWRTNEEDSFACVVIAPKHPAE